MTVLLDFHFCGSRTQALVSLMRHYPSYSPRRGFLKGINALNQMGPRRSPRRLSRIDCPEGVLPALEPGNSRAFLLHKIDQKGRIYVFDEYADRKVGVVTKIALNEGAAEGIRREAAVLQSLAGRTPFHLPEVLSLKSWNGGCALRVGAIPRTRTVHKKRHPVPDALLQSVAALRPATLPSALPASQIEGWESALARATTPAICRVASHIGPGMLFAVNAAHRDLGSENLFSHPSAKSLSDFSIIDWEFFTETAPALTDRVGVWIGRHHRTLKRKRKVDVEALATQLLLDFESASGGSRAAVVALLHLADIGIDLARILTGDTRGTT